ncbi:2-amino-3,7-dideoxy-D-threo-hept-6-ulosonate synthase [subsurface metagenome]
MIESTLVPVLSLGGEKMENDFFSLKQAEKAVMAGAKGVVFGRNLYQSRNPKDFLKALKDVVRGNLSSEEAVDTYGLSK